MKKNKRLIPLICCVALLVCAAGATLAWLTDQTDTVKNTFTSSKLFVNADEQFTLWEHGVEDADKDGRYELTSEIVTENTYTVFPGVDIPKDPTIDIKGLEAHAYLYIKVIDNMPGLKHEIDSANWEQLEGTTDIWVYKGNNAENNVIKASDDNKKTFTVSILANNHIVVPENFAGTLDGQTLSFEAYMVQATGNGANAVEAWNNTYGKSN